MNVSDMTGYLGLIGAGIGGYAYLPQITHLVKEKCSAGISRNAFALWLAASVLVSIHAVDMRDPVFMFLGAVQIVSIVIILAFATRYRGMACPSHLSPATPKLAHEHIKK